MSIAAAAPLPLPGWTASLQLEYEPRRGRTALVGRHHTGPLSVQRPFYPDDDGTCHTYILHPPAGIVGGDDLGVTLDLAPHARVLMTTPGATRWYYSDGRTATLRQRARVADAAVLEWLPQETLLFDGAHARSTTRIELEGDARYLGCEITGLGRPACAERYTHGELDLRFELFRDGTLQLRERLVAHGTPRGLRDHAALMTFIASGADPTVLAAAREQCVAVSGALCAATLIDDVLICRGLAHECAPLIIASRQLRQTVRPLVLGAAAAPPRIWRT